MAPGTDWEEMVRTRRAPRRLAPDPEDIARKVHAELRDEGWTEVEILDQAWDDHPQVGKAWWISLDGVPPPGSVHSPYGARMFIP